MLLGRRCKKLSTAYQSSQFKRPDVGNEGLTGNIIYIQQLALFASSCGGDTAHVQPRTLKTVVDPGCQAIFRRQITILEFDD
jgi:hypothetical protein